MPIIPSLQALWLADEVSRDDETGKITLAGIFDQIEIQSPAEAFSSSAFLFFAIGGVHGETELVLAYVDLSDNSVLLERRLPVASESPLATTAVCIPLPSIPVPHPGVYAWELYWNDERLGTSRVTAEVSDG